MWSNLRVHTIFHNISAEVYLDGPKAKDRFEFLANRKAEIEARFGGHLDWDLFPDSIASRIRAILPDVEWQDSTDRDRQYEWLFVHHQRLLEALAPAVAALKAREATDS